MLVELNETRDKVKENLISYQENMKTIFDKKSKYVLFQPEDIVLRWDFRREYKGKHGKFDPLWYGPFKISESRANDTFVLENLDGEMLPLTMNGNYLKHYFHH